MDMLSIKKVAEELNVGKDYALRLIKRRAKLLGLKPYYGKRNAVSLSREDADRLIGDYKPVRPFRRDARSTGAGCFYIIQLHPEDLPNRLKIGYTDNIDVRLSDHRTSAPTLKLVKCWPCKRNWEDAAKASITRDGCKLVGGEVFDGDIHALIERAEAFFAIMPRPHQSSNQSLEPTAGRRTERLKDEL
jgi:hypothetical protein